VHGARAHAGVAALGGDARGLRGDRGHLARRGRRPTALRGDLREPPLRRAGGRRARRRPGRRAPQRRLVLLRGARARVRLLGRRRVAPGCWRSMVEVQDAGRPADPTGYR
jgi:hypothetical protein